METTNLHGKQPRETFIRNRVTVDCSSPKLTDQSQKNMCDINNIMKQYAKTSLFTHVSKIQPQFMDNTQVPTLEEAFEATNKAIEAFYTLPADIRKLMDNDPAKLELYLADPNNADTLKKHGLLIEKTKPEPETTLKDVISELKNLKQNV